MNCETADRPDDDIANKAGVQPPENSKSRFEPANQILAEIGRNNQPKFSPCGTTVKITLDLYL